MEMYKTGLLCTQKFDHGKCVLIPKVYKVLKTLNEIRESQNGILF